MHSQVNMFQPVLRGLNKIIEETVPRFLNETLETRIPPLVDHLYKKTSVAAPEKELGYYP
jgi:hypothetical protein